MTLYLKYRPNDFDSLVGQEFIKNTLKKEVEQDKTVWAYLFCWPRWTGKTSTARILAKAINCLNNNNWNPCNKCDICNDFSENKLVDIIEIDAASNTWVDNIRDIIEKAKFSPTICKYKVYIIDEVHMLSKWAFNALLKILEEPPSHLKFILATTEIHKVPETIISRCQRYDFLPISQKDIENRLLYVAKKENIKIDPESLSFIASRANWWLRNALSLLEQFAVWWVVEYQNIIDTLWIPKKDFLQNFLQKLLSKDISVLDLIDTNEVSKSIQTFFKEFLFFIKDKMIDLVKEQKDYKDYLIIFEILEDYYIKRKNSFDPKTTFTVWVLKVISVLNWGYNSIWNTSKIESQKEIPKTKKIESKDKKNTEKKQEIFQELEIDDVVDIFSNDEADLSNNKKVKEITQKSNSDFNKELFIWELKKLKAKWAITMSIRSSNISLNNNILTIKTSRTIPFKQLSSLESINILNTCLKNMWYNDIKIEIK